MFNFHFLKLETGFFFSKIYIKKDSVQLGKLFQTPVSHTGC